MPYFYNMMGYFGGGMWFFGSLVCVLFVVFLILGILALWKYINKK